MLQNRVDPFGNLIKTKARGSFMGNRGIIHNERQEICRTFKLKAWLICLLEFEGRHREVMAPDRYTELFFLDEASAFAAGHRPCFECRRADYNRFKSLWLKANPEYGFDEKTSIRKIDDILHHERIKSDRSKNTFEEKAESLPDGTFIVWNNEPCLISQGMLYPWTPFGYQKGIPYTSDQQMVVLTPKSVVRTFHEGYSPQMRL